MMKRTGILFFISLLAVFLAFFSAGAEDAEPVHISVLILPKFEVGSFANDFPGEAQYYFMEFLEGGDEYEVKGGYEDSILYVRDGVALYVTGMGKVNAALSTFAVLSDPRFDFSDAYILSTGCAGSAIETGVMGDVFLITAAVDFDLGHHADAREMADENGTTWFHDEDFDSAAVIKLNEALMDSTYDLVEDVKLETTERTRKAMSAAFNGAEWAVRDPRVLRGTTVTADNYWKGMYDHRNALLMTETYGCSDPYATTEMEDLAVGQAVKRMGLLDRLIIIRSSVNTDVFMLGASPESLWDPDYAVSLASEDSEESVDIFATAMENNFKVGRLIVEGILNGTLSSQ